jgi:hypothetical protein
MRHTYKYTSCNVKITAAPVPLPNFSRGVGCLSTYITWGEGGINRCYLRENMIKAKAKRGIKKKKMQTEC